MSIVRRLEKIETSLTPSQASLLFLKELQQSDTNILHLLWQLPAERHPRARFPEMAVTAVRNDPLTKGCPRDSMDREVESAAWRQTDFLVVLVLQLNMWAASDHERRFLCSGFLRAYLGLMPSLAANPNLLGETKCYHGALTMALEVAYLMSDTLAEISRKYFKGEAILIPELQQHHDSHLRELEVSARIYNLHAGRRSEFAPIDFARLHAAVAEGVAGKVEEAVAYAKVSVFHCMEEWQRAWQVMRPYRVAKAGLQRKVT